MVMPLLSVTIIGLLAGAGVGFYRPRPGRGVLLGLVGASIGFAVGAIPGLAIDVVLGSGTWLPLAGHGMALIGAVVGPLAGLPRAVVAQTG